MKIYTGTTERTMPWGTEVVMFDVEMDLRVLNAMARKAANNKSMRSTDGALTVKVIGSVGTVSPEQSKP